MPFWQRFRKKTEQRAQETYTEDPVLQALLGGGAVTRETALQVPTVAGGIDLIANLIASTPVRLYRDIKGKKAQEEAGDYRLRFLNGETGDTLNAYDFWKALVRDYYLGKGGYAYIHRVQGRIAGLHYVDERHISILRSTDPIFKDFDILVDGQAYKPYDFLKILRNTTDGAEGVPITRENARLIETAYAALLYERNMARRGGNKKGFLKSEKALDAESLAHLRSAFARMYSADSEGSDNFILLNKGIDFQESSNTSVELQLNENKLTNAGEFAKLFHISADCISGKASEQDVASLARLAAVPLMRAIECALNRDLLLESEKGKLYFAFDTKELLRGDMQSRFAAYKTALDANFMQIDEVRYAEDMEPLGLDWVRLGLQDVLYDPKTGELFTPNTGTSQNLRDAGKAAPEGLTGGEENDILEERARHYLRGAHGHFAGSTGGGSSGGGGGKGGTGGEDCKQNEKTERKNQKETDEKEEPPAIIKADKVISGHSIPKKEEPGSVIDHLGKDGKVETRTFYGSDGYKEKEITNHDHGFPAKHPYGKHGEHAHDYEWDETGKLKNRTIREITEKERKENRDIL